MISWVRCIYREFILKRDKEIKLKWEFSHWQINFIYTSGKCFSWTTGRVDTMYVYSNHVNNDNIHRHLRHPHKTNGFPKTFTHIKNISFIKPIDKMFPYPSYMRENGKRGLGLGYEHKLPLPQNEDSLSELLSLETMMPPRWTFTPN